MNFIQRFIDDQIKSLGYVKAQDAQIIYRGETLPGESENPWANWELQHFQRLAMAHPAYFSNIKLIADSVALGEFEVQEKKAGKWENNPDHELSEIIDVRPNPNHSQYSSWWYQTCWLMLQGEAYWMIADSPTGNEIAEMYRLPAGRIKPMPDDKNLYSGFAYTPRTGQQPTILEPKEIIYHMLPNPFEYRRGYSPLIAYLSMLKLSYEADKFDIEDYQNGLSLRHIISLRAELSQRDKYKFEEDMRAAQQAGLRYWIARGGDIDVKEIASRRDEKANNETVHQRSERIANLVLGVPDGLRARNATEANALVAERTFINNTIWPLMTMLAEDITTQQVIHRYGPDVRIVPKDIRPENIELKIKETDSRRKVQSFNEAREADGLNPFDDPDVGNAPFEVAGQVYLEKIKLGLNEQPEAVKFAIDNYRNGKATLEEMEVFLNGVGENVS